MKNTHALVLALASALALCPPAASGITIAEVFTTDPLARSWIATGNSNLFQWHATNLNLEVTWDSSQTNSYFCRPIENPLTKASDFMLSFDLRLNDIAGGVNPGKPFPFQISIGLFNLAQATNASFVRGSGYESPNLVEFDYFPGGIFDPTVSPVLISSNNEYSDGGFTFPLELQTNAVYHVKMIYLADDKRLITTMKSNGVPFGPVKDCTLNTNFSDFSVDHFGVSSYSDVGQFPGFEGSVLAHGVVDNFMFAAPPPVMKVEALNESGSPTVQFRATTNWLYSLERTTNFQSWNIVSVTVPGVSGTMQLQDTNPPAVNAFYRVHAEYP